jgi:PPOX class probable F420-dependent enzyme
MHVFGAVWRRTMAKMKILSALLGFLCLPLSLPGQNSPPATPERTKIVNAAKEVMQKAHYCALVTIGDDGHPQARVVDPFLPEEDMTVWIATNPVTRKVAQIKKDPRVTLLYYDPDSQAYVTILGRAQVISDPVQKAKRWKEAWATLYKNKNRGDDYVLIQVKPARLEIVSYAHGLGNDPRSWRPVVLELR